MEISFILTTLAGLATLFGTLPIFVKFKDKNKLIGVSCSFASGVMVSISIINLIPESIAYLKNDNTCIFVILLSFISILLGIFISYYIDKYLNYISNNKLFNVGILSMIVIILHNIPEGIITFIVSKNNIILGISLCIAIAIHNIPEGISIAIPIYYATKSKIKAILYTLVASLSEPFGALLTYLFLSKYIDNTYMGIILSFTAGIMIAISLEKLYPTSKHYHNNTKIYFIIGFICMIISLLLENLIS